MHIFQNGHEDRSIRVLVTGGAGYIGSHTAKQLAAHGFVPVVLDNLSRGHRDSVRWGPFIHADVRDRAGLRRVLRDERIDAVIHFAAFAYVAESMTYPGMYFRNNDVGMLVLLEEMINAGIPSIVYSSSCATYGLPTHLPIGEGHHQQPINPYGESKLVGEWMLRSFGAAYGVRWVTFRYFNAAGADADGELGEDHDPEPHLIPSVIDAAMGRKAYVDIYGTDFPTNDGTAVRDYVYVGDLADAHVRALKYLLNGGPGITLNLGSGRGHSVREVVRTVEAITGRRVPVHERERRPGDPPILIADPSRAREILGWEPRRSDLCHIIETAVKWRTRRAPVHPQPALETVITGE